MSIESVSNSSSGMSYQGSTSQTTDKQTVDVKKEMPITDAAKQAVVATSVVGTEKKNEVAENNAKQTEQMKKAIDDMIKKNPNTEAIFGIHEGTKHVMIKIIDKDTKKVIREYPSEETLDIIEKVWELAGLMFDKKR
jgi:flagellar protein FlaG